MKTLLKKSILFGLALSVFASPTLSPSEVLAAEQLTMTSVMYSSHPAFTNIYFPLLRDRLKAETNGEVELIYYEPGMLVPDKENFQAVADGLVDVTSTIPSYTPNLFLAFSIMDQPMLFDTSTMGALVAMKLLEESKAVKKEFKDVKVLWTEASVPNHLLSKEPILTLEDMKGKRIGVRTASVSDAIKLLGGVPVLLPASDMYISLQRGMIDGVLMPIPQYTSSKVVEVAKHMTPCALLTNGFAIVMNKDRFETLPASAQKYIESISGEVGTAFEGAWIDYSGAKDVETMIKVNDLQVHDFPEAEKARWVEKVLPMHDAWKEKMAKNGIDSNEVMAIVEKWSKYYSDPANVKAAQAKGEQGVLKGLYPPQL